MSDLSAIRLLQTAIENVRETCTGAEYKNLLKACDSADEAAEAVSGGEPADDSDADDAPKTLKGAAAETRKQFAAKRR